MVRTVSLALGAATAAVIVALMWTLPGTPPVPRLGATADFTPAQTPEPAPEIRFAAADGSTQSFADFAGRAMLVNFWATWCGPCVREMPSLERLQIARGGERFVVIALSEDRQGWPVMTPFLDKLGLKALPVFHDAGGQVAQKLGVTALPTTILFGRDGREIGRMTGPLEWDQPEAAELLDKYLGG